LTIKELKHYTGCTQNKPYQLAFSITRWKDSCPAWGIPITARLVAYY